MVVFLHVMECAAVAVGKIGFPNGQQTGLFEGKIVQKSSNILFTAFNRANTPHPSGPWASSSSC